MTRTSLSDIILLKLAGDPTVYFTEVKSFIECSLREKLLDRGVEVEFYKKLSSAFEANVEKLPSDYSERADLIVGLLKEFEHFDRQLDWYNGEQHNFPELVKQNSAAIDAVLALFKTIE